jgi:3-oxoacyl-[acyl-carrier-protein] synthase II
MLPVAEVGGFMASSGSSRPVWITGLGAVTGYGWGRKHVWDGLVTGESAVRLCPGYGEFFDQDEIYIAEIPDDDRHPDEENSRFSRALKSAAREAFDDARDRGWEPGGTVGLIHAFVLAEVQSWKDFYLEKDRRVSRREWIKMMPSTPITSLMIEFGLHGPCMSVVAMCASGNAALLTAKMWIDAGIVDDVLVLGADVSATPENARHFANLGVVILDKPPLDACRPFQEGSTGFVGGEAAVGMVVSSRNDGAYATLRGGAMGHDAHHVISLAGKPAQIGDCYQHALDNAGVTADDVVYFNAHGPGTKQCDRAEALLFDQMFPDAKGIYSFKPLVGHCQAAAASIEVAIQCMAYEEAVIPAPPQVAAGHPRLLSGLVPREPGVTFKSSIGMGGYNTAIVLDEPPA